jgi:lysozyme
MQTLLDLLDTLCSLMFKLSKFFTALSLMILISISVSSADTEQIAAVGPGNRIFGLDISRYQHTQDKPIDFEKMYNAGVRFLMINGGNTLSAADSVASNYYFADRSLAQAAGIFTGMYYYVHLPNTKVARVIVANAHNQALKIINRLNQHGGYGDLDLPVALDLETTCTHKTSSGVCRASMSKNNVGLWTRTWLTDLTQATGRKPIVYSYLSFLSANLSSPAALGAYPLWIATAGIDPSKPESQPGIYKDRCFRSPWSDANCYLSWTFWQYSSGGAGARYGLQTKAVDLDIFNGSSDQFLAIAGVMPSTQDTSTVTSSD